MLHPLTFQWAKKKKKKATQPRSIPMGQGVYSIHSEGVGNEYLLNNNPNYYPILKTSVWLS